MSHLIGDLYIFASITLFICAISAYKINRPSPLNKTLALMCILIGFGSLMNAVQFYSKSPDMCMLFNKLSYLGWCFYAPAAFHFGLNFSNLVHKLKLKSILYITYLPGLIFLYFNFSDNLQISDFYIKYGLSYLVPVYSNNLTDIAFLIYQYLLSFIALSLIIISTFNSKLKRMRRAGFIVIAILMITILLYTFESLFYNNIDHSWFWGFELITVSIGLYFFIQNLRFTIPAEYIFSKYVADKIDEMIMITNAYGIIEYSNIAMNKMLIAEVEVIKNKHINMYLPDIYADFQVSNQIQNIEFDYVTANNKHIQINVNAVPIRDNYGDHIGNIFICSDLQHIKKLQEEIAERKRIEEVLIKADRERDDFLSLISHELLSPLSAMFLWIDLAKNDKSLQNKSMEIIEENARRQFELVDELLFFTRLQHGKIMLNVSYTNLSEIINQAISSDENLSKKIVLNNYKSELPIQIDTEKIVKAMITIIKFASESANEILLNVNDYESSYEVVFAYHNQSQIYTANINDIFNPFRSDSKKVEFKVSELKMATAQKIAELNNGKLYSSFDETSKLISFTLQLPK